MVILSLPLPSRMACPLFQGSPQIAASPFRTFHCALSGSQMMCSDIGNAHELIHEGRVCDLVCLMLVRNRWEILTDDGDLDVDKSSYLISLWYEFLSIRWGSTFNVEPYSPHWLSRQFGFCQGIPRVLLKDLRPGSIIWWGPSILEVTPILGDYVSRCSSLLLLHIKSIYLLSLQNLMVQGDH